VKDAAPHFKKAKKYYDQIAKQLVAQGHALDIFACSLDQVGRDKADVLLMLLFESRNYHSCWWVLNNFASSRPLSSSPSVSAVFAGVLPP
jgi:hypothetical protein